MAPQDDEQVRAAYAFFTSRRGQAVKLADIIAATEWKLSTVRTYFAKKWKGVVLEKASSAAYTVIMPEAMTLEQFVDLHTQIDPQVG